MGFLSRFFGPPSEDQFARLFQKMLAQVGSKRTTTYDKENFRLTHDSGFTNLRNIYVEYCGLPRPKRAAFLSRTCLLMAQSPETPKEFEDARHDLMPTVRSTAMQEDMKLECAINGTEWKGLPSVPLSEHLVVCLVYDLPTAMQFVNQEMLNDWGVSLYEALEAAKENLEQRDSVLAKIGDSLYMVSTGDAYDATRMLLTDKIRKLEFKGDPVAMPVTRESLLLSGSQDEVGVRMMADLAENLRTEARPVCPIAHTLVDDEWQPWLPPVESPNHDRLRMLALQFLGGEYSDQKKLLEKRNEQTETDVVVASFSGLEKDGKTLSFSVWSKGIVTWLPQTEYVCLGDHEADFTRFVRWERLQDHVGTMLHPLEMYPPRWQVADFPTLEQIEAMEGEIW